MRDEWNCRREPINLPAGQLQAFSANFSGAAADRSQYTRARFAHIIALGRNREESLYAEAFASPCHDRAADFSIRLTRRRNAPN
jgi:hypothetical protein